MKAASPSSLSTRQRATIFLDVQSVDLLLHSHSSPFAGPHLHPEAATRIMIEARSFPKAEEILIKFRVPAGSSGREEEVKTALRRYGTDVHKEAEKELKEIFKDGRFSLLIGSLAVVILLAITESLPLLGDSATLKALSESLIIFYWVILWRPAELLLYDHIPARRRRRLARLLERAEVSLEAPPTKTSGD